MGLGSIIYRLLALSLDKAPKQYANRLDRMLQEIRFAVDTAGRSSC
jgi:hypothetical protein